MASRQLEPGSRILVTGGSGFIGTNLVEALARCPVELRNLDRAEPLCETHRSSWVLCDILDRSSLVAAVQDFAPTHVIHLAARADCEERRSLANYRDNTEGTANTLDAVRVAPSVKRLIMTSTQFVCRPGHVPRHDEDYAPHTLYGQSKVVTEQLTRHASLRCAWTIIRPTTIWGPWLWRHREQLFPLLHRGLYVHPGLRPCIRSWGYVGNVVQQILGILELPSTVAHGRTLYVGDEPINLLDWVNVCSRRVRGRGAWVVPRSLVRILALAGDVANACGQNPPIDSSRFRSMTEDYLVPMAPTFDLVGPPVYSMEQGVEEVVRWWRETGARKCPDASGASRAPSRHLDGNPRVLANDEHQGPSGVWLTASKS